jgi:hypothetical protein
MYLAAAILIDSQVVLWAKGLVRYNDDLSVTEGETTLVLLCTSEVGDLV